MRPIPRLLLVLAGLPAVLVGLSACGEKGPAEKIGEAVDEAAEDTGESLEDAADEVEDAVEDMGD